MPRSVATAIENNFVRGLITEASGLNFPENACTSTDNCHFELTGEVRRRKGFDFESGYITETIDRTDSAITTYIWKGAAGTGDNTLLVVQVGGTLYFYDTAETVLSNGILASNVSLATFQVGGSPNPDVIECQFSVGNGYLFVTHPHLTTFYCSYDPVTQTISATAITLQIRDFLGLTEAVAVDARPVSLTTDHKYNLTNQGWGYTSFFEQSATSQSPSTGSKVFTVAAAGPWVTNQSVYCWAKSSLQGTNTEIHYMIGTVTSYSGTTLTLEITSFGPDSGGGAHTDWNIAIGTPPQLSMFQQVVGTYPSNGDVWWLFKDSVDQFNPRKTLANVSRGGTPAPKGHFILDLHDQDRSTVSGIAGITPVTTGVYRPSTSAFFSGRVFYSGIPHQEYGGEIYFSQILKSGSTAEFGHCYQVNDPTSETLFDLLPNDGGVISIPEAGTILKLWAMQGGLLAFATNGIWQISGSTGLGFTANDYSVRKLSSINALSATSFVDVGGYPAWWSSEGIYIIQPDNNLGGVSVKSLTDETILTYYSEIPNNCKKQAHGCFNLITKKIYWLFRSSTAATVSEIYEYDKVLLFNARTTALNPWTISDSSAKIHAVISVESSSGIVTTNQVIDDIADTVIDDSANNVVTFGLGMGTGVVTTTFKYLVSYPDGGSYKFTFAEETSTTYRDWYTLDSAGIDYTSYFISGYKVRGQAQRKFQSNYIYVFSNEIPSTYNFQALWDYANSGDSGSWSSQTHQTVVTANTLYDIRRNRLKIRGEGLALQFKVYSEPGEPFSIIGWSSWETGNASI